jgi:hypothetical protein
VLYRAVPATHCEGDIFFFLMLEIIRGVEHVMELRLANYTRRGLLRPPTRWGGGLLVSPGIWI